MVSFNEKNGMKLTKYEQILLFCNVKVFFHNRRQKIYDQQLQTLYERYSFQGAIKETSVYFINVMRI